MVRVVALGNVTIPAGDKSAISYPLTQASKSVKLYVTAACPSVYVGPVKVPDVDPVIGTQAPAEWRKVRRSVMYYALLLVGSIIYIN